LGSTGSAFPVIPKATWFTCVAKVPEIIFMRNFLAEPDKLERSQEKIGQSASVHELYTAVTA